MNLRLDTSVEQTDAPSTVAEPASPAQNGPAQNGPAQGSAAQNARVPLPAETQPIRIAWAHAITIVGIHLLALLAFVPWFFSWTGVVLAIGGVIIYGTLGINLCYHRILTHQGLVVPKWLEHFFATLGVCCLQDSPARWVAVHRMHHKHSDHQPDPHTPLVNFLWGHCGWLFVQHREHSKYLFYENYARDILRDPFYLRFERKAFWLWTYVLHAVLYFVVGLAIGWGTSGVYLDGVQFGASLLVWGVLVRTVLEWHNTWAVNSVTHTFGYRNYDTNDDSRNHWLIGLMAFGEGWHNNHHADQRSAKHGHRRWELDLTWVLIRLLETVGLAKDIVRPRCERTSRLPADP